ncbi:MAG: hypothetical protein P3X22_006750 [Thermoprotei archaeon]|nr:hypothetical protein [Thermoprotei archaeon]
MSTGTCELCGSPASSVCSLCGRLVCPDHYGRDGVCSACLSALCSFCGVRLSIAKCVYCGRLGCESCLVQVDNVRRACRDCLLNVEVKVEEARRGLERLRSIVARLREASIA